MTDTKLLRQRINDSGLKLQYIAGQLGISRAALTMKIEGKYDFRQKEISELCKLLRIETPEEVALIFLG